MLGKAEAGLGKIGKGLASPIDTAGKGAKTFADWRKGTRDNKIDRLSKAAGEQRAKGTDEGKAAADKLEARAKDLTEKGGGKAERLAGGIAGIAEAATFVTQPKKGLTALGQMGKKKMDEMAGGESVSKDLEERVQAKRGEAKNLEADSKAAFAKGDISKSIKLDDKRKKAEQQAQNLERRAKAGGYEEKAKAALDRGDADEYESNLNKAKAARLAGKTSAVVGKGLGSAAEVGVRVAGVAMGTPLVAGAVAAEVAGRKGGEAMEKTGKYVESKSADYKFRDADDAKKRITNSTASEDLAKVIGDLISGKTPGNVADVQGAILAAADDKGKLAGQAGIPGLEELKKKLVETGADDKTIRTFENISTDKKAAAPPPTPAASAGAPAPASGAAPNAPDLGFAMNSIESAITDGLKSGKAPTINVDMDSVVDAINASTAAQRGALDRMRNSISRLPAGSQTADSKKIVDAINARLSRPDEGQS
jgi:hypothetical protein